MADATGAGGSGSAAKPRVNVSVYVRLIEGKELASGELDSYATIKLNHRSQLKTKTIYASDNPLWDEDVQLEPDTEFEQLDVIVWESGSRFANDRPLGKVVLAAEAIAAGPSELKEQWIPLQSAAREGSVTGEVTVQVKLSTPVNNVATLNVLVVSGSGLVSADVTGFSDPYVSLQVLPDPEANSTQLTKYKKKTLNPKYNESFSFPVPAPDNKVPADAKLHLSVWDWDRFTEDDFMGFAEIRLNRLPLDQTVDRVLGLRPMPPTFRDQGGVAVVAEEGSDTLKVTKLQKGRSSGGFASPAMARRYVRDYQTQASALSSPPAQSANLGSIRIKYKYSAQVVLPAESYDPFIKAISGNQFQLPVVLGKVSNEREDAAWAMVKAFDYYGGVIKCITQIANHEVQTTSTRRAAARARPPVDSNTIFRGNSMASKAIDVYMKMIGLRYLKDTIGDLVKGVITSKHSLELDPARLEKGDDAKKNLDHLISTVTAFANAIFASVDDMPPEMARVFSGLRTAVQARFPDEATVPYTVISGFLFLRLFVAATMTPVLFGLWHEHVSKSAARSLTLVAKTIQNLANLVTFGQKEPYMADMNDLIVKRIPDMKQFLERAAAPTSKGQPRWQSTDDLTRDHKSRSTDKRGGGCFGGRRRNDDIPMQGAATAIDIAKEDSKLFHHFLRNRERILGEAANEKVPANVINDFVAVLDQLGPLHVLSSVRRQAPALPRISSLRALAEPIGVRGARSGRLRRNNVDLSATLAWEHPHATLSPARSAVCCAIHWPLFCTTSCAFIKN